MRLSIYFFCVLCVVTSCKTDIDHIAIIPTKGTPKAEVQLVKLVLAEKFNAEIIVLPEAVFPSSCSTLVKSPRLRADSIIDRIKYYLNDTISHVMCVTSSDISTTKRDNWGNTKKPEWKYSDWGICGLAYRPGRTSVISTYRIKTNNSRTYHARLRKIATHELGHNMGLPHCENENCVMRDAAESVKTIDSAKESFCASCRKNFN